MDSSVGSAEYRVAGSASRSDRKSCAAVSLVIRLDAEEVLVVADLHFLAERFSPVTRCRERALTSGCGFERSFGFLQAAGSALICDVLFCVFFRGAIDSAGCFLSFRFGSLS